MLMLSRCVRAVAVFVLLAAAVPAVAQQQTPEDLLDDFVHYVLIARYDLAQSAAESLMNAAPDDQQLLDVVEASHRRNQIDSVVIRAKRVETLKDTATQLEQRLENARMIRAREPARIRADILKLAEGERARNNAIARLKAAGQFAGPHLLEFLLDDQQRHLHPFILTAMVAIGRDLVYPLSVSLAQLPPRGQGQVAHVLAEIGYQDTLPYFKQVLEMAETDPSSRAIVDAGYHQLLRSTVLDPQASASQLFLLLGRRHYATGTQSRELAGYDNHTKKGILWKYSPATGLVPVAVPGPVYADDRAMEVAEQALRLEHSQVQAHSLWLTANLRRENRLPEGETDPSYRNPREPTLHARIAGPQRLHDVLERALRDGDTALSRDAIAALDATAGTMALINDGGPTQPLLGALHYPDRRVRFEAAFALTNARPKDPFPASFRVVPVLAETVRQTAKRYALVLSETEQGRNALASAVKALDYTPISGVTMQDVREQLNASPGVDIIVTDHQVPGVEQVLLASSTDYQTAAVPVVAIVSHAAQIELSKRFEDERRLLATNVSVTDEPNLRAALEQAATQYAGPAMDRDEATRYASQALTLLRDLAISSGEVYNVYDAQGAMIAALKDERDNIVTQAAEVLAILDNDDAQRAIAEAALDPGRLAEVRVKLLASLAASIKSYGNRLSDLQVARVVELLKASAGEMALATARVHGALMPPTESAVDLIIGQ